MSKLWGSLQEKAALLSGFNRWRTKGVKRLGIPPITMSDGTCGLNKDVDVETETTQYTSARVKTVCLPAGVNMGSSFDRELLSEAGAVLGKQCRAEEVDILLGPGLNIKRSPLCGRNFEYYSEDPFVSGELAAAFVGGIQAEGVGACPKHFFANNQEYRRMSSSSEADERTFREIYLSGFETVVKKSHPYAVMAAYNRVNGIPMTEHHRYLTEVLRKEWGFDGIVVSDWDAVSDRVNAVVGGCDLTMPADTANDHLISDAVRSGALSEAAVDAACSHILSVSERCTDAKTKAGVPFDFEAAHAFAKKAAEESMVLLKNNGVLPLKQGVRAALIGDFAKVPRYQGGGSSHLTPYRLVSAAEAWPSEYVFAQGFERESITPNAELIAEAVETAVKAEAAVIFVGLPEVVESEGYDRPDMRLPDCQNALIESVCRAQPNTIVVLFNGAPIEMPWAGLPAAILEAYLPGQACGEAVADLLFGKACPSGRLAETFPIRLEDTPAYLSFPGERNISEYREGVFVGYRSYVSRKQKTLFPFGYGLSYTQFAYSDLRVNGIGRDRTVSVSVKNIGNCAGKEVVQLYIEVPERGDVRRPVRELKGFEKISLLAGEEKICSFSLDARSFSYWSNQLHDWAIEGGAYKIQICRNAEEVIAETIVEIEGTPRCYHGIFTPNTLLEDVCTHPVGKAFWEEASIKFRQKLQAMNITGAQGGSPSEIAEKMRSTSRGGIMLYPLKKLLNLVPGFTPQEMQKLLEALNAKEKS